MAPGVPPGPACQRCPRSLSTKSSVWSVSDVPARSKRSELPIYLDRTRQLTDGRGRGILELCRFKMARTKQLLLPLPTWGGKRRGAGRKPKSERPAYRTCPGHSYRSTIRLHVTWRMLPHVWNLRSRRSFRELSRHSRKRAIGWLPADPLLCARKSPPPDRGGFRCRAALARFAGTCGADCARSQPNDGSDRKGIRGPLPPACPALAGRGRSGGRIRAGQLRRARASARRARLGDGA